MKLLAKHVAAAGGTESPRCESLQRHWNLEDQAALSRLEDEYVVSNGEAAQVQEESYRRSLVEGVGLRVRNLNSICNTGPFDAGRIFAGWRTHRESDKESDTTLDQ